MAKISIMKFIFSLLFLLIFSTILLSQKPQEILGIAKEDKSTAYYKEQFKLWSDKTQKKPTNGYAWRQKYLAQRAFLQKSYPEEWQNEQHKIYNKLDKIIKEAKPHIDQTFEYYFIKSQNCTGEESVKFSQMAYDIDPSRKETYGWLFVNAVIQSNEDKADELGKRMVANNIYSNANLLWNLNSLNTMTENSIFIGDGDLDILPKWVLQHGDDQRKDILVISKWNMVNDDKYRKSIYEKIGVREPVKKISDFVSPTEYAEYLTLTLLRNGKRKAYMSCGTDVKLFEKNGISNKMYLVGTAYVYSENRFDNKRVLRENLNKYQLDHLLKNYQNHPEDKMIDTYMHLSYLPAVLNALEFYHKNKMREEITYYEKILKMVASKSGREAEVLGWYNPKS